jgi:hypothetical protein
MLGARADLERFADVDAAVGRQVPDILDRLQAYRAAGRLPSKVIVQMGENGPVWNSDIKRLETILHGASRVVLVNVRITRSWEGEVNSILAQTAHAWEPARLVDWVTRSGRPGMIYGDLTHSTKRGARAYAAIVRRALLDRK